LIVGLAVCNALKPWLDADQAAALQIKWPNDILLHGCKLAGMLCERPIDASPDTARRGQRSAPAILGVGVNANLDPDRLGSDLHRPATSLQAARGRPVDIHALIQAAADHITAAMQGVSSDGLDEQMRHAIEQCLAWRGQSVSIEQGPHATEGRLRGIDGKGHLILDTASGPNTFDGGELMSLRQPCGTA
jgi:BirA family biotin operon repressor/biotin-[acetyl-CoA-carboxylase] ligase